MKIFFLFVAILASSCAHVPVQTAPNSNQATPSLKRAMELLEIINSGEEKKIKEYVLANFDTSIFSVPDHIEGILWTFRRSLGFKIKSLDKILGPTEAIFIVSNNLTQMDEQLGVEVDDKPPYKIKRLIGGEIIIFKTEPKLTEAQSAKELKNFLDRFSKLDKFSGAALLAKGEKIIFQGAYGEANKDFGVANNINTKFNLGSINKMFTAIAIAQLIEQNKLSFDDNLSKFMPDFPDKISATKIKISHLLSHTSGLGSYFNDKFFAMSREKLKTIDDYLAIVKNDKLEFEPGERFKYSNVGFLLLGKIIEIITSMSYFDYIRKNIYLPADMKNSDSSDLSLVNNNLAVGYEKIYTSLNYIFKNNLFENVINGGPAGGGYSTVGDLLKFALALQNGKLVSKPMFEQMISAKSDVKTSRYYGYGIDVETDQMGKIVGHAGGFTGISATLSIYLDKGYIAIVLSNYGEMSALPIEFKMKELVGRSFE